MRWAPPAVPNTSGSRVLWKTLKVLPAAVAKGVVGRRRTKRVRGETIFFLTESRLNRFHTLVRCPVFHCTDSPERTMAGNWILFALHIT